ncbi:MAG: dTDP-4-dehydrorhamnose 3,5-epimerase family protein [Candidatus Parcubacteria bacterium]|nr:dTDP-4-dehydrorhamnose 3,5-epimerase family protein [Burkholderiales bacterium]
MFPDGWKLHGMKQDVQSITRDWQFVHQTLISGVQVKPVSNVPTGYGHLCEVMRMDWKLDATGVDQVFFSAFDAGGVSGWHAHALTTDRLFVAQGRMEIVLFDSRQESPTHGEVNRFRLGTARPALVSVPPGIWHAVRNGGGQPAVLINIVDRAYQYEQPDHYRLPLETDQIPFRFEASRD